MQSGRWMVLATAATVGIALWLSKRVELKFSLIHLFAVFVVLFAFASALQSINPAMTLLKATSLGLLFVYGSIGGRFCFQDRRRFMIILTRGAEALVWISFAAYALFSFCLWDNGNSLGAVMGVLCWPILLWKWLVAGSGWPKRRTLLVMIVCAGLLYASHARAAMLAAGISSALLLLSARRYKLLLCGVLVISLAGAGLLLYPEQSQQWLSRVVFKAPTANQSVSLVESRRRTWSQSMETLSQHPILGIGFGISEESANWQTSLTSGGRVRERGSSYLSALEQFGFAGSSPLAFLLITILLQAGRVLGSLMRHGNLLSPAIPVAALLIGALCHAGFEDWLLAAGYYLSLVFWALALSMPDLAQGELVTTPIALTIPTAGHP